MDNIFNNDEFDNMYESVESIYYEKNAIEKEKDPYIRAKERVKELFNYNSNRGTILVNGEEHKITFNREKPTDYNSKTDVINFGEDTRKRWTDNDLRFSILHELGHKKSLKFDKNTMSGDDITHIAYAMGKTNNKDYKSALSKVEKMLKGDRSITRDTLEKEYPNFDDEDYQLLFKWSRAKIKADKKNNGGNTKEKIDNHFENKYQKYNKSKHFDSEEAIADEYARKQLGDKNTKKAIKRLYDAHATDHANLFKRLAIKMRSRELKDEDDIRDIKQAFGKIIPDVLNIENMSYEERIQLANEADLIADNPLVKRYSKIVGTLTDNRFVNLMNKGARNDMRARKKALKDKEFRKLMNDNNKKDVDKKFADKASKNKR